MTTHILSKTKFFGAALMIGGCCIGAGMIGLPILSLNAGFLPSLAMMFFTYLFTTGTGLLLLEATLWFDSHVNLMTIAQFALGRVGKWVCAALFLSLFYTIFVAYYDGGGAIVSAVLSGLFSISVPHGVGTVVSCLGVGVVLRAGMRGVDRLNRVFMFGLFFTYMAIVVFGIKMVRVENLSHVHWKTALGTLPILFICFGFQNLVPSLTQYLHRNARAIRGAIIIGNMIPFLLYALWNYIILGMIVDRSRIPSEGCLVAELVQHTNGNVLFFIQAFSFFALFTSFVTVAISFVDFLRDGFKKPPADWVLQSLVLVPPLWISFSFPHLFLKALNFAGGIIDVLLYGVLPVAIVWVGRGRGMRGSYQVRGGHFTLVAMALISLLLLLLQGLL